MGSGSTCIVKVSLIDKVGKKGPSSIGLVSVSS